MPSVLLLCQLLSSCIGCNNQMHPVLKCQQVDFLKHVYIQTPTEFFLRTLFTAQGNTPTELSASVYQSKI